MSALAIPYPQRGYTKTPHGYFQCVFQKTSRIAFGLLGLVLDFTVGQIGEPEWVNLPLAEWARLANCTEDSAMRGMQELVRLGYLATRNAGRKREYKALTGNFGAQEIPIRPRRKILSIRKPAGSVGIESQVEPVSPGDTIMQNQEVKQKVPDVEIGYLEEPCKFKVQTQGPFASVDEVRDYLVESIAPKLSSLPVDSICQRTFELLRTTPRGHFKNRVELRKNSITAWGAVPMLASDAAQFHKAFSDLKRINHCERDLTQYWTSVSELRRMWNSADTPELVKSEISRMLPEWGGAPQHRKTRLEQIMDTI